LSCLGGVPEQLIKELTEGLSAGFFDQETKRGREYQIAETRAAIAPMKAELQRLETEQYLVSQDIAAGNFTSFSAAAEDVADGHLASEFGPE
jgi:hypothetical protein